MNNIEEINVTTYLFHYPENVSFQVTQIDHNYSVEFIIREADTFDEITKEVYESSPYAEVWIKSNSCAHAQFESSLHLCGEEYFKAHCSLMAELIGIAKARFKDGPNPHCWD